MGERPVRTWGGIASPPEALGDFVVELGIEYLNTLRLTVLNTMNIA